MKIRKERFFEVPLCQQECDAWWDDCKEDHACIENWTRGFNWSTGEYMEILYESLSLLEFS